MERFSLLLQPSNFRVYEDKWHLPSLEFVLRPLISKALECFVYGLNKDSELLHLYSTILIEAGRKFKLDLEQEVINGYEPFWNATSWARGSIAIILDVKDFVPEEVFPHCFEVGIFDNPNTGHSKSAVDLCKKEALNGRIAFCIPASNGFEWIDVFSSDKLLLSKIARRLCRRDVNVQDWSPFKKPKPNLP